MDEPPPRDDSATRTHARHQPLADLPYLDGRSPISGAVAIALLALGKLSGPRTPLRSTVEQLRN